MPVDVKDIVKKAEVSHSTVTWALQHHAAIAQGTVERIKHLAREFSHLVQGGIENVSHSLITQNSFSIFVFLNQLGVCFSKVFIHYRVAEGLLHSLYDDVNAISVEAAST